MDIPIWQYLLTMGSYFTALISIVSFMRKHYRFANVLWIAALFTFPLWLMGNVEGWFRWAKNLSVFIPTIFVGFARISNYEQRKGKAWKSLQKDWVLWVLYGVLFLNIMEATLKDFQMGNNLNALAGLLLCVTIPFPNRYWKMSKEKPGDLIVYTTIGWNLLYTTWNACFVFGESPIYFASSVCILLAAELYPVIKKQPELYIMARVYTLATHLLIRACFGGIFPILMNSSSWYSAGVLNYWGVLNGIFAILYVFWYTWQLHTGRSEKRFIRDQKNLST
ncbi:hypothetical protein [Vallitalea okinawensis]|uniref:hypothetical protein n=1 Tax=Vallitalea okinawensis TaxID=2078660 RepID=UPI000CFBD828|nr:hypothetical protein [Vallitalea okinawensis]